MTLGKGENAPLPTGSVTVELGRRAGGAIPRRDVCALLRGAGGTAGAAVAPVASPRVRLSKVTLTKQGGTLGELRVGFNWQATPGRWGAPGAVDLGLCALCGPRSAPWPCSRATAPRGPLPGHPLRRQPAAHGRLRLWPGARLDARP